jgi:hypothetical protein
MKATLLVLVIVLLAAFPSASFAWDYVYDGSVLPSELEGWSVIGDLSMASSDGDCLSIVDNSPIEAVSFSHFSAKAGEPFTVEARLKVIKGDGTLLIIGSPSYDMVVGFWPHNIGIAWSGRESLQSLEMMDFATIRVSVAPEGNLFRAWVWANGSLIGNNYVVKDIPRDCFTFGSGFDAGCSESYWDYVACSNAFVPVPEPSSLAALGFGILPFVGVALRRRHRK